MCHLQPSFFCEEIEHLLSAVWVGGNEEQLWRLLVWQKPGETLTGQGLMAAEKPWQKHWSWKGKFALDFILKATWGLSVARVPSF